LIDEVMNQMEEYCGSVTDITFPDEPVNQEIPSISTLHQKIKKKKLN
jgi:hypothetical protein